MLERLFSIEVRYSRAESDRAANSSKYNLENPQEVA